MTNSENYKQGNIAVIEEEQLCSQEMDHNVVVNVSNDHEDQRQRDTDEQQGKHESKQTRRNRIIKSITFILIIGLIVFVIVDSLTNKYVGNGIKTFLEWVQDNPVPGFFVFVIVYFLATILFVPGLILTLGAGFVFGNAFGVGLGVVSATLAVFFGASSGAIVSFLLGRYLFRDWALRLTKKYTIFEALDQAFKEKGFRIMALLRLSPLVPFNVINYIAGVTSLSLIHYSLALVAILPGTTLYVFLGASAGSLTDSASSGDDPTVTIIVIVIGLIFGVAAVAVTSIYAKKELNKIVANRQDVEEEVSVSVSTEREDKEMPTDEIDSTELTEPNGVDEQPDERC